MSISRNDAINYIEHFYTSVMAKHGPYQSNPGLQELMIDSSVVVLDERIAIGKSVQEALETLIHFSVGHLGEISGKLDVSDEDMARVLNSTNPTLIAEQVNSAPLIDLLYPNASPATKAQLLDAIQSGHITNTGMTIAVLDQTRDNGTPSAGDILETVLDLVGGTAPSADFHYPGLSTWETDFITALYIGMFGRGPETEGLTWWSSEVKNLLDTGMSGHEALGGVAKFMYHSGTVVGEGGTDMSNADFVTFAYQNSLGREPDAGGHAYWTGRLNRGEESRDSFAVSFLGDALGAGGDQDYLNARVAVAKWAAQEHVSGHGKYIDLVAVLQGVATAGDAYRKINELKAAYGEAPAMAEAQAAARFLMSADDDVAWDWAADEGVGNVADGAAALELLSTVPDAGKPAALDVDVALVGAADAGDWAFGG